MATSDVLLLQKIRTGWCSNGSRSRGVCVLRIEYHCQPNWPRFHGSRKTADAAEGDAAKIVGGSVPVGLCCVLINGGKTREAGRRGLSLHVQQAAIPWPREGLSQWQGGRPKAVVGEFRSVAAVDESITARWLETSPCVCEDRSAACKQPRRAKRRRRHRSWPGEEGCKGERCIARWGGRSSSIDKSSGACRSPSLSLPSSALCCDLWMNATGQEGRAVVRPVVSIPCRGVRQRQRTEKKKLVRVARGCSSRFVG